MPKPVKDKVSPFSLYLREEERAILEKEADGTPLGPYIRSRLFSNDVQLRQTRGRHPIKDHQLLGKLLAELGKAELSHNLNSLADAAKSGSLPVTLETQADLQIACSHVADMRRALLKALGIRIGDDP